VLRRAAVLALLAACASPAAAAEREVVAYLLGGLVSGPYRVSADLGAGTVEESRPPGAHGDGAGLDALTMPATRGGTLPAGSAERIRALAGAVLRDGAERRGCLPTIDALVRFHIVRGDVVRDLDASSPCMAEGADRLRAALMCGMEPGTSGCLLGQ
jgi:hypothetical protein